MKYLDGSLSFQVRCDAVLALSWRAGRRVEHVIHRPNGMCNISQEYAGKNNGQRRSFHLLTTSKNNIKKL